MAETEHVTIQTTPSVGALDDCAWRLSTETESKITTLAAICHARQKQRNPLDCDTGAGMGDLSEEYILSDADDSASTRVATLTDDSNIRTTKTEFLDRLAEILCSSKDASFVTCASITMHQESVTILVARNALWTDEDVRLMEHVAKAMEDIASRGRCKYSHMLRCTSLTMPQNLWKMIPHPGSARNSHITTHAD